MGQIREISGAPEPASAGSVAGAMLYSETEAHIVNLDHCASRDLRRAYLALMLAAERAGFVTVPRVGDGGHQLQIRDPRQRLLFAVQVARDALSFELRRPALDSRPELAGQAQLRFAGRLTGSAGSGAIAIRLVSERDAEDLVDWLLAGGPVSTLRAAAERWFG